MHLISADQFRVLDQLERFFDLVVRRTEVRHFDGYPIYDGCYALRGRIMSSLFFEPSLRTRFSFETAMHKLGGSVITSTDTRELSLAKGESFEDTIRTLSEIVDVIVLRHREDGMVKKASLVSKVPVINAGDGSNEHPTQALLDMFTISRQFSKNITVCMVGDMRYGRAPHSLCRLLSLYPGTRIIMACPPELTFPEELLDHLKRKGVVVNYYPTLQEALKGNQVDVVYMTRLQRERMKDSGVDFYKSCTLTRGDLKFLHDKAMVMHPLPRNDEISAEMDGDSRCIYFSQQVPNGVKVRMGLLYGLFYGSISYQTL